jgi:hypothetical protein
MAMSDANAVPLSAGIGPTNSRVPSGAGYVPTSLRTLSVIVIFDAPSTMNHSIENSLLRGPHWFEVDMIPQALNPPGQAVDEVVAPLFVKIIRPQLSIRFMAGEHNYELGITRAAFVNGRDPHRYKVAGAVPSMHVPFGVTHRLQSDGEDERMVHHL